MYYFNKNIDLEKINMMVLIFLIINIQQPTTFSFNFVVIMNTRFIFQFLVLI